MSVITWTSCVVELPVEQERRLLARQALLLRLSQTQAFSNNIIQ